MFTGITQGGKCKTYNYFKIYLKAEPHVKSQHRVN